MRTIAPHRLLATVVIAALLGVIAGFSVTSQSTAGSVSVASSGYCGGTACVSHTWLWVPAMRRAR
jgi:hypothetical protein